MPTDSLFLNAPVHRTVSAGEPIYREGDVGSHMFGIVSGEVTLYKGSVAVASLGPNDVFGERALIDHLPRNLTAVATAETTLAEIRPESLPLPRARVFDLRPGHHGGTGRQIHDYDELIGTSSATAPARPDLPKR